MGAALQGEGHPLYEYEGNSDATRESPEVLFGEEVTQRVRWLFALGNYQTLPTDIAQRVWSLAKPPPKVRNLFDEMPGADRSASRVAVIFYYMSLSCMQERAERYVSRAPVTRQGQGGATRGGRSRIRHQSWRGHGCWQGPRGLANASNRQVGRQMAGHGAAEGRGSLHIREGDDDEVTHKRHWLVQDWLDDEERTEATRALTSLAMRSVRDLSPPSRREPAPLQPETTVVQTSTAPPRVEQTPVTTARPERTPRGTMPPHGGDDATPTGRG